MENENLKIFNQLRSDNVGGHTKEKDMGQGKPSLKYLTWSKAWELFKQVCPDATYKIIKNENNLPYFASDEGIMVYTEITVNGLTHEMWLAVMDGTNRALKTTPYTIIKEYKGQKTEKVIPAATMCDINKTIMRCLVKNMAMFGLGLHVYEGEDITMLEKEEKEEIEYENALINAFNMINNSTTVANLTYVYTYYPKMQKDERFMDAIFIRLEKIVNNAQTEAEIGEIYQGAVWAQKNPRFLDMCSARKVTLQQEMAC